MFKFLNSYKNLINTSNSLTAVSAYLASGWLADPEKIKEVANLLYSGVKELNKIISLCENELFTNKDGMGDLNFHLLCKTKSLFFIILIFYKCQDLGRAVVSS